MEKYGFVYIWYDKKHKRYYVGCHWGNIHDGYICSSSWMKKAHKNRPNDFKRRILVTNIKRRQDMYLEEQKYLEMIKKEEIKPHAEKPRYYNLNRKNGDLWHKYDEKIKTIGQKISDSKKGKKTGPRDPSIGQKISEAKRKKRMEKEQAGLPIYNVSDKVIDSRKNRPKHTEEHKQKISKKLMEQWSNGTRKKKSLKQTMSREEQNKLSSQHLKNLWSDPMWAENQKKRLSEGAKNRPPRTEESKIKTSISVKKAKNINKYK